jgi:hypothetical protein
VTVFQAEQPVPTSHTLNLLTRCGERLVDAMSPQGAFNRCHVTPPTDDW